MNAALPGAPQQAQLASNVSKVLALGFFQTFLVLMPVIVPFFRSHGLDMQDVFVLQALFGAVVVLMELPSGYLADRFGRRGTLITGALFLGLGHSCLLFADGFIGLALFESLLGIGVSLVSGADLAVLYDTEIALGRSEAQQNRVVGRLYAMHTTSEAVASLVCAALVLVSLDAVVWAQAAVGWLPLLFALSLVEPPTERMSAQTSHFDNIAEVLRHVLAGDGLLRWIFLGISVWSMTTFYAVWVLQQYWTDDGVPLAWFGVLWAAGQLIAAEAGRRADVLEARIGPVPVIVLAGLLPAVGYFGMAHAGMYAALGFAVTFFVARGLGVVILRNAFNRRVPSRFRATANSLASFGFRLTFVVTGPIVGWWLDVWGMTTALMLLGAITLVIFAVVLLPLITAVRSIVPATADPG